MRYYFDIRDNGETAVDEEGLELPDLRAAEVEAAKSLAGMARDRIPTEADRDELAIEVRTKEGPLFRAAIVFDITRTKQ